jgi:hypothetical protein
VAGVGASKEAPWGSSPERGERGKERGVVGVTGGCQGGCRRGGGARPGLLRAISLFVMLVVREGRKQEGGRRREEREKKRRREGKKEKEKMGIISKLRNF